MIEKGQEYLRRKDNGLVRVEGFADRGKKVRVVNLGTGNKTQIRRDRLEGRDYKLVISPMKAPMDRLVDEQAKLRQERRDWAHQQKTAAVGGGANITVYHPQTTSAPIPKGIIHELPPKKPYKLVTSVVLAIVVLSAFLGAVLQ